jgi:hypothetical protein
VPEDRLPKLAYIADVPVEASYHGSALLYRLLEHYPPERLRIVETTIHSSQPPRRLKGVEYRELDMGDPRWLSTRFHTWVSSWFSRRARGRASRAERLLDGFKPDAVLTVGHGYSWLPAASLAKARGIPLHLVVHDDWPRQAQLLPSVRAWLDREFGVVYRQSISRFCVSRSMEETYRERYGAAGSVLLPSRAASMESHASPPARLEETGRPVVFGFGGTVNTPGYVRALRQLADVLDRHGAVLHLYGPISADDARSAGLDARNIRICGLVKAPEFISRMRQEVDVLFLPMSFDPDDRENMRLCFPSKLADYTATGLPLLAYGPADSSGIRWGRENPAAAEVVDWEGPDGLNAAVERLLSASHRFEIGKGALAAGRDCFSHQRAESMLYQHLARSA